LKNRDYSTKPIELALPAKLAGLLFLQRLSLLCAVNGM